MDLELTFAGEELDLVMDALRAAVPVDTRSARRLCFAT